MRSCAAVHCKWAGRRRTEQRAERALPEVPEVQRVEEKEIMEMGGVRVR